MPQQINLLTPILLAPKRYFSAVAMLQATGLLLLAGLALGLWLRHADARAQAEHEALLGQFAAERQALLVARAGLPVPTDPAAVGQQLDALLNANAERQHLLQAVSGAAPEGRRHSDLLALLARSLPESAWLSELRWSGARLELVGGTLDTAGLRPWLAQLASHPLLKGQVLSALRVERLGNHGGEPAAPLLAGSDSEALRNTALPVWAFRVVSAPALAASAASGVTR